MRHEPTLTLHDLDTISFDGHRYEVVDHDGIDRVDLFDTEKGEVVTKHIDWFETKMAQATEVTILTE